MKDWNQMTAHERYEATLQRAKEAAAKRGVPRHEPPRPARYATTEAAIKSAKRAARWLKNKGKGDDPPPSGIRAKMPLMKLLEEKDDG